MAAINKDTLEYLDRGGCEFGQDLVVRLEETKDVINVLNKQLDVCTVSCNMTIKDVLSRISALESKVDRLREKILWLMGAYTVTGAVIGYALSFVIGR